MKCEKCQGEEEVREVLLQDKGKWVEKATSLCKPCRKKCICKYVK